MTWSQNDLTEIQQTLTLPVTLSVGSHVVLGLPDRCLQCLARNISELLIKKNAWQLAPWALLPTSPPGVCHFLFSVYKVSYSIGQMLTDNHIHVTWCKLTVGQ